MAARCLPWTSPAGTPARREEETTVFDIHCTACARRWLVTAGQVTGIVNDDAGIHVHYRCRCGADGVWLTGRTAREERVLAHAS